MVKDHSDSERGNPLPPQGLFFPMNSKGSFICTSHRQDSTYHGLCYTSRGALAGTRNSSMGPPHEGSIWRVCVYMCIYVCMWMYVYLSVCVCACVCVYMCMWMYQCVYICMCVYVCFCMYVYVYMCMHVYVCVYMYVWKVYTHSVCCTSDKQISVIQYE